jgi:hypothetical protein
MTRLKMPRERRTMKTSPSVKRAKAEREENLDIRRHAPEAMDGGAW